MLRSHTEIFSGRQADDDIGDTASTKPSLFGFRNLLA